MPKIINHRPMGSVVLTKRRNSRSIRLSVSHSGVVKVSLPRWLPYSAGMHFVHKNSTWIESKLKQYKSKYSHREQVVLANAMLVKAKNVLPARLEHLAKEYGYKVKDVRVRRMSSRWGSCTLDGKITLNIFLLKLPQALIDYVICHELAHLNHHGHQAGFWNELAKIYPDYKNARKQLRAYSPRID